MKKFFLALVLTVLAAPTAPAQVMLLSSAGMSSVRSQTTTPIDTTGANMIAVCSVGSGPYSNPAPTDSVGNSFTLAKQYSGSQDNVALYYVLSPITSASYIVTMNGGYPGGAVAAYSGVASGPDQTSGTGDQYSPTSSGTLTPTKSNELILSCFGGQGSGTTPSVASPLAVVNEAAIYSGPSANVGAALAQQIQTTATSVNPTWTYGTLNASIVSATFYAAAPAAPTAPAQVMLLSSAGMSSVRSQTTTPIDTTGANMIAVCSVGSGPYSNPAPTDSVGNSFTLAKQYSGSQDNVALYYVLSPITSASYIVTMNGGYPGGAVAAYSGVASGPDQTSGAGDQYSPQASGNLNPSNANELILSCLGGVGSDTTPSVASPLAVVNEAATYGGPGANVGAALAQQIQTTATSVNPTWTIGTLDAAVVSATFYSAAAPSTLNLPTFSLPEAFAGIAYSYAIPANGGIAPVVCALTSGILPSGFSLSGCRILASSPQSASTTSGLVFKATDSQGDAVTSPSKTLTVASAQLTMPTACPSGTQLEQYAGCNLTASGGTPPYTYSFLTDKNHIGMPEGLELNSSTGNIPQTILTGQGIYGTTYTVADSAGASLSQVVNISINGNNTFAGTTLFPVDNFFHGGYDITALALDTAPYTGPLGGHVVISGGQQAGVDGGIPINYVSANTPNIPVSCPGSCYQNPVTSAPFSATTAIENTQNQSSAYNYISDGHALIVQAGNESHSPMLYETYSSQYDPLQNAWLDVSNQKWDLTGYDWYQARSSSDAAGLPLTPLLPTYDAVMSPSGFKTPIRFTLPGGQTFKYTIWPATDNPHGGGGSGGACSGGYQGPNQSGLLLQSQPPTSCGGTTSGGQSSRAVFGSIWRIKASYFASPSAACLTNSTTNPQASSIFSTLRHYGGILADVGGSNINLVITEDARWNPADLACLYNIPGSAFEQVDMTPLITTDSNGVPLSMKVK